jgi:hypothetical protein
MSLASGNIFTSARSPCDQAAFRKGDDEFRVAGGYRVSHSKGRISQDRVLKKAPRAIRAITKLQAGLSVSRGFAPARDRRLTELAFALVVSRAGKMAILDFILFEDSTADALPSVCVLIRRRERHGSGPGAGARKTGAARQRRGATRGRLVPPSCPSTGGTTLSFRCPSSRFRVFARPVRCLPLRISAPSAPKTLFSCSFHKLSREIEYPGSASASCRPVGRSASPCVRAEVLCAPAAHQHRRYAL